MDFLAECSVFEINRFLLYANSNSMDVLRALQGALLEYGMLLGTETAYM
jgi:hypothetical protein